MIYDAELDFLSKQFNPLKALRSSLAVPPSRNARPLDNVSKCKIYLSESLPSSSLAGRNPVPQRNRTNVAKQRVGAKTHDKRSKSDIMESMMSYGEGPLSWLADKAKAKSTVRVITRHRRGTRGVAEGSLIAFDKHMNLVLRNVEETYTVRLLIDKEMPNGSRRRRPVLETRKRSLPNVLLTGRSVVCVSDSLS